MNRCPNCGWEIQFGTTCYNCVGREQDAKRHGGKPINPNWRRRYISMLNPNPVEKHMTKRVNKREEKSSGQIMKTSINRSAQRKGINRFLHDIYGKDHFLSDILYQQGFTKYQIQVLKQQTLKPFLDDVVEGWIYILRKGLSWQSTEAVRYYYELEGIGKTTIKLYKWSGSQEKRFIAKGIKTLRMPSVRKKLENKVLSAAKRYLK